MKNDLCSMAAVWNIGTADQPRYWGRSVSWTAGHTMEARGVADRLPYPEWVEQGYLIATDAPTVDFSYIAVWLQQMIAEYDVRGLAYDPWRIKDLKAELAELSIQTTDQPLAAGSDELLIVPHPQRFLPQKTKTKPGEMSLWMHTSMEVMEDAILEGRLTVEFSPVLRYAVLATVPGVDASNNRRLDKPKSRTKIDPCVALTQAVGLAAARFPGQYRREIKDLFWQFKE